MRGSSWLAMRLIDRARAIRGALPVMMALLAGCHLLLPFGGPTPDAGAPPDTRLLPEIRPTPDVRVTPDAPGWPSDPVFGTPRPVRNAGNDLNLSTSTEQEPFLTADGLTLFFCSNRNGSGGTKDDDIYYVHRETINGPFGEVHPYKTLNTDCGEWGLVITADRLNAYLTTNRPHPGETACRADSDIWVGERNTTEDVFVKERFRPLDELNTPTDEFDTSPSPDNLRLYYYTSNWFGTTYSDLLVAERSSTTELFGKPQPIPGPDPVYGINVRGPVTEGNPVTSPDELLLLFNSSRPGGTYPGTDIWYANRKDRHDAFSQPRPVDILNTTGWDTALNLTEHPRGLFFGRGGDLYWAPLLN